MPGHWECKYCDNSIYVDIDDERRCSRCGAEWEDCKIFIIYTKEEYEKFIEEYNQLEKDLARYEAMEGYDDNDLEDEEE